MQIRRTLAFCLVFLMVLSVVIPGVNAEGDMVVDIPDPNLEREIRVALNYPDGDITQAVLESLENIFGTMSDIEDLTGLEHAVNLRSAFLEYNFITDISPLRNLPNLSFVDLRYNLLELDEEDSQNLEIISELQGRGVDVRHDPLAPGEDDEVIDIPDPALEEQLRRALNNYDSPITANAMKSLYTLFLWEVDDLTGLEYATGLEILSIQRSNVDLSIIANLDSLARVSMDSCGITDISPLEGMSLAGLGLYDNQITDITTLLTITGLDDLNIRANPLDLAPGSDSRNVIDQLSSYVADFAHDFLPPEPGSEIIEIPDAALLKAINAVYNYNEYPITREAMESISFLDLIGQDTGDIASLSGLEHARNLEHLTIWGSKVSNLQPLAGLTNLRYLVLKDARIADISALAGLSDLRTLNLARNRISDISELASLMNLSSVDVSVNNISDISVLKELPFLNYVFLQRNSLARTPDCPSWGVIEELIQGGTYVGVPEMRMLEDETELELFLDDASTNIFIPVSTSELYTEETVLTFWYGPMTMEIPASTIYDSIPDGVEYSGLSVGINSMKAMNIEDQLRAMALNQGENADIIIPDLLRALGAAFAFEMYAGDYRITEFARPFPMTIRYYPGDIEDIDNLGIFRFNPETAQWDLLPITVDAEENTITASIDHWSEFALLEGSGSEEPEPETEPILPETGSYGYWLVPAGLLLLLAGFALRRKFA